MLTPVKATWAFCVRNWLIFGFGLGCLLGYLFPHVAARGGIIRSEYSVLYAGIGLIFFINGMQLSPEKLREHVTNWRLHIVVQGINMALIPLIQLAIIHIIIAAGAVRNGTIDASIIVGMVVAGCIPTTIASNVVMTRNSGGDEAAAIIEVVIGNVLGSILSPWLIYGFIPTEPEFASYQPAPPNNLGPMYKAVMMQLGLAVLLPLVAGQVLRWLWPRKVLWVLSTFYLAQFCSVLLIMVAWTTFSGAFQTGSLYALPTSSVVFNVFVNIAEYLFFTALCFYIANPPLWAVKHVNIHVADSKLGSKLPPAIRRGFTVKRMPRDQTIAVCFCGAAKTTSLGIPLIAAMWSQMDDFTISAIQVPVLLYTVEQVFVAQFFTIFFKNWLEKESKAASDVETADGDPPVVDVDGSGHPRIPEKGRAEAGNV
ncbi:putative sodium bile acid cotransporter [Microdochium trichocladiopsis]|uniref:Sodium bile acid cotransporter n=1 Tax=Microdochium trichocladiopsis TaxID=1682393 RepID=A0A9P9BU80_9PEZI|nr:putative sodium bile acid cotransporter [Microdochium trichocladiopsis]KAH7037827.1 putative sodium bile acid cotransporter [Microdochium trichocladiopsis]